jgi:hypothetical protein
MNWEGRITTSSQGPMESHLHGLGLDDEAVFSLLWLSERFGSVTLNSYEDMEDDWGGHRSLTLQISKVYRAGEEGKEYVVIVKNHPYY